MGLHLGPRRPLRVERLVPPGPLVAAGSGADAAPRPRHDLRDDRRQLHAPVPAGARRLRRTHHARGRLGPRRARRLALVLCPPPRPPHHPPPPLPNPPPLFPLLCAPAAARHPPPPPAP